jgi:hypothetical protein
MDSESLIQEQRMHTTSGSRVIQPASMRHSELT